MSLVSNMTNHINIGIFLVLVGAWQAYGQAVTCTAVGRFADPTDTTCQNYTYCVLNAVTNTFTGYNYVCPTTSVFNPATSQCTDPANYNCTVTTTVADPCTADGFVADPNSTDCSSYIQCVQINGIFSETTLTCPPGTFYDPTTTFCESTYVCTTTTTTVTTLAPTTVTPFTCTAVGRFANSADTTCQSYYYCVSTGTATGNFTQYQYTCPTTSVFNPAISQCTSNYVCPTS